MKRDHDGEGLKVTDHAGPKNPKPEAPGGTETANHRILRYFFSFLSRTFKISPKMSALVMTPWMHVKQKSRIGVSSHVFHLGTAYNRCTV